MYTNLPRSHKQTVLQIKLQDVLHMLLRNLIGTLHQNFQLLHIVQLDGRINLFYHRSVLGGEGMAGIYCVLDHFADEMVVLGGEDCVECLDFFIPGFYLIQDFR